MLEEQLKLCFCLKKKNIKFIVFEVAKHFLRLFDLSKSNRKLQGLRERQQNDIVIQVSNVN